MPTGSHTRTQVLHTNKYVCLCKEKNLSRSPVGSCASHLMIFAASCVGKLLSLLLPFPPPLLRTSHTAARLRSSLNRQPQRQSFQVVFCLFHISLNLIRKILAINFREVGEAVAVAAATSHLGTRLQAPIIWESTGLTLCGKLKISAKFALAVICNGMWTHRYFVHADTHTHE